MANFKICLVILLLIGGNLYAHSALALHSAGISAEREALDAASIAEVIASSPLAEAIDAADKRLAAGRKPAECRAKATDSTDSQTNRSDRPREQDQAIDVFASALYWYTSETLDWAFTLSSGQNSETSTFKTIFFDWAPGFRVGAGYNMHHDQWDTQFTYTWFQSQANDHASGSVTSGFLATRLSLLEPFQKGKINLNLHYNMFDWDLGRSFFVSRYLVFRPFIGAKAGWINQKIIAKWESPSISFSSVEKVKNNFAGGGPLGGVMGKWILGNVERHVFSLRGTCAAAYLWGHWHLRDTFVDSLATTTSIPMQDRNFGALMLQALLGFGWDFNFDKNRSHFTLNASYEIQDWLNHFQVFTNASGTDNFDLILQGLTVDLRFDF